MTEPSIQTAEASSPTQPATFAQRMVERTHMLRQKISTPVARTWTKFSADIKQRMTTLRSKLQLTDDNHAPIKKRTLVKIAFGNFRHSWKDAFDSMKLRYFIIPNAKKIDPKRMNWTQGKSIISILGGAAIGGAIGIHAYALPYVFVTGLYMSVPLLALGIGIRAIAAFIPKGALKNAVKGVGKKTFAAGVICAMWPMVGVGIIAFAGLHAGITTAETLIKGFGVSLRAAYLTVSGKDSEAPPALPVPAPDTPATSFAANAPQAGADFSQAAADTIVEEVTEEAKAAVKRAARKPRSA